MPVLLDERAITLEFSDILARRPIARPDRPLRRADGLHQSGIIAHIARKIGKLKSEERDESEYPLLWGLGIAWEEWMVSFYPEVEWQPGEEHKDGIHCNCDGLSVQDDEHTAQYGALQVEEFKFSFKGVFDRADFITNPKSWMWMHQGREYCYQYEALRERWHVCHVRGDYKNFGPVYKTYTVGFSQSEVEGTHKLLLANMDEARAAGMEER